MRPKLVARSLAGTSIMAPTETDCLANGALTVCSSYHHGLSPVILSAQFLIPLSHSGIPGSTKLASLCLPTFDALAAK